MIKLSVLTHFNYTQIIILKCDFLDDVSKGVLSQYENNNLLHSVMFFNKNLISIKCNYKIYNKKLLIIIYCLKN